MPFFNIHQTQEVVDSWSFNNENLLKQIDIASNGYVNHITAQNVSIDVIGLNKILLFAESQVYISEDSDRNKYPTLGITSSNAHSIVYLFNNPAKYVGYTTKSTYRTSCIVAILDVSTIDTLELVLQPNEPTANQGASMSAFFIKVE